MSEQTDYPEMPGEASRDEIRAELLRTADVPYWRPHGTPDGTPTDFSALPEAQAHGVIKGRLMTGPGANGTAYQWALWEHHQQIINLEKEQARILGELAEVSGYDPKTGEGIPATPPDKMRALGFRLEEIRDKLQRSHGEPGRKALELKLEEAVEVEIAARRRVFMVEEAKRRAEKSALEDEINRLAEGFRKTRPNP